MTRRKLNVEGLGQVFTPTNVVDLMLSLRRRRGRVLEPSCGDGAFSKRIPDCVAIAHEHGIKAVIQPGGSIKDQDSIGFCDSHGMAMVTTGYRHFKH